MGGRTNIPKNVTVKFNMQLPPEKREELQEIVAEMLANKIKALSKEKNKPSCEVE